MARKAVISRNEKRIQLVAKYAKKRKELKKKCDMVGLQKLPRNSSPVRVRNRCCITGRSRGYMRGFGVSRIVFREEARKGNLPGIRKSSW